MTRFLFKVNILNNNFFNICLLMKGMDILMEYVDINLLLYYYLPEPLYV